MTKYIAFIEIYNDQTYDADTIKSYPLILETDKEDFDGSIIFIYKQASDLSMREIDQLLFDALKRDFETLSSEAYAIVSMFQMDCVRTLKF